MRCINCGVDTHRLRRHLSSSLPGFLNSILAQWITIEVPMDAVICNACFKLLSLEGAGDVRLCGHTMLCINCGHSVRNVQRHTVERNDLMMQNIPSSHPAFHQNTNYACHRCWIRHQRQTNQDRNGINAPGSAARPETEPPFEQVPNYEQQLHVISGFIKKLLLVKYNFYTPTVY